jgi:hypothetical protein
MTRHSLCGVVGITFVACVLPTGSHEQDQPSRYLSTTIEVKDARKRPEGLSFELFGRPSSIALVVVVVNNSPDPLIFPSSWTTELGLRVERAGHVVPAKPAWERIEVALPADEPTDVSLTTPFTVAPEGVARFHGVLTPTALEAFGPGDYTVLLNLGLAFAAVRDGAGKRWAGHHAEEGSIAVRVTEPRTPAEHQRANANAANAALLRGDAAGAVRHFTEVLRTDPNDLEALYGSGVAYLDLRRYRDAAAAFETVIPRMPTGVRTTIYYDVAFAYLALGEDARAEAILTKRYGATEGKRQLARIREAARKR